MKRLILIFICAPLQILGQEFVTADPAETYVRPKYYELGAGLNIASFRDYATSPLIYSGGGGEFVLGIQRKDEKIESGLSFRVTSGAFVTSNDGRERTSSTASSVFINYSRLYRILRFNGDKWNMKVGGKIDVTGNVRLNPSLFNNSTGIESFQTLFGSAKITNDISRNELKRKKFLFIRYKLKPKKRDISFQFNTSLINSTYRNGFAYLNQSPITGSNDIFEGYKFSRFSGLRMSSALELTRYLQNGNGIKYSYIWDAYKTGGDLPQFAMSNHMLQLSLLFRVK